MRLPGTKKAGKPGSFGGTKMLKLTYRQLTELACTMRNSGLEAYVYEWDTLGVCGARVAWARDSSQKRYFLAVNAGDLLDTAVDDLPMIGWETLDKLV